MLTVCKNMSRSPQQNHLVFDLTDAAPSKKLSPAPYPQYHFKMPTNQEQMKEASLLLHLLLHAVRCYKDNTKRYGISADELCVLNQCQTTKELLTHIRGCLNGHSCKKTCQEARRLISHWKICVNTNCGVCLSGYEVQLSNKQNPDIILDTFRPLSFPTLQPSSVISNAGDLIISEPADVKDTVETPTARVQWNKEHLLVPQEKLSSDDAGADRKTLSALRKEHEDHFRELLRLAELKLVEQKQKEESIADATKNTIDFTQEEITSVFQLSHASAVTVTQATEHKVDIVYESVSENLTASLIREKSVCVADPAEVRPKTPEVTCQQDSPASPRPGGSAAEIALAEEDTSPFNRQTGSRKSLRLWEKFRGSLSISFEPLPSKRRRLRSRHLSENTLSPSTESIEQPLNSSTEELVPNNRRGRPAKKDGAGK